MQRRAASSAVVRLHKMLSKPASACHGPDHGARASPLVVPFIASLPRPLPIPVAVPFASSVAQRRGAGVVAENALQYAPTSASYAPSSQALVRVANLASAWAKVARRLPPARPEGGSDVGSIIRAIRLALVWLEGCPPRRDGRDAFSRTVQLAVTLAELSSVGLPLDADGIAAAVVSDVVREDQGHRVLDHHTIRQKLGDTVASLVHDILRVRTAPQRVELYDDTASSAIREWCIAFNDVRACVVEVVSRWDELQHMDALPMYERQQLSLEALQVYAPLGHALGIGAVSSAMEDACFQVLFPESYTHTSEWLRTVVDPAEQALYAAQQQLLRVLDAHPRFNQLASGCVLRARTKSLFSMMKKLLRLGDMSKGGRKHGEVFDLLGMRAVVQPRTDLPHDEAEQASVEACYIVKQVAEQLWNVVPGRTKDYIKRPKTNGYRCIHITVCMHSVVHPNSSPPDMTKEAATGGSKTQGAEGGQQGAPAATGACSAAGQGSLGSGGTPAAAPYLELQIRTQSMDDRAETGDAAHTAYKGGLDSRQARQLQAWSQELQQRLAIKPQGKLLLPPSVVAQQTGAFTMLDSVDIDGDMVQFDQQRRQGGGFQTVGGYDGSSGSSSSTVDSYDASGSTGIGSSAGSGSPSRLTPSTTPAGATYHPQGSPMQPSDTTPSVSSSGQASEAISQLFCFMDRNGDGRISLDELREQLSEVATAVLPPAPGGWQTPYGAISFDHAADVSALSLGGAGASPWGRSGYDSVASFDDSGTGAWVRSAAGGEATAAGGLQLPEAELDRLLRSLAGEGGDGEVDMSLEEFAAFLKQASALRNRRQLQEQQRQQQ